METETEERKERRRERQMSRENETEPTQVEGRGDASFLELAPPSEFRIILTGWRSVSVLLQQVGQRRVDVCEEGMSR